MRGLPRERGTVPGLAWPSDSPLSGGMSWMEQEGNILAMFWVRIKRQRESSRAVWREPDKSSIPCEFVGDVIVSERKYLT